MDRRLLQILNDTACLSKNQLQGYVNGTLQPEEIYAVEMHLIECPICNDALEGFATEKNIGILLNQLQVPPKLPSQKNKEKKQSDIKSATINTIKNVVQPVAKEVSVEKKANESSIAAKKVSIHNTNKRNNKWLKPLGVAAALAIGFTLLWYFEFYHPAKDSKLADNTITQDSVNNTVASMDESANIVSDYAAEPMTNADSVAPIKTKLSDSVTTIVKKADTINKPAKQIAKAESPVAAEVKETAPAVKEAAAPAAAVASKKADAEKSTADTKDDTKKVADEVVSNNKPQTDYDKGMSLYRQQDYGSAILYLRSTAKNSSDPKYYNAIYYSAMAYKNMGRNNKAKDLFKKLVKDNAPQKASAQKQLDAMD